jgi:hypothetical protein
MSGTDDDRLARSRTVGWGRGPSDELAGTRATLDLFWIPLGAGARVVRISGRVFEALSAFGQHRPRCALYHSALVAQTSDGLTTIEMAPIPNAHGTVERGVVAEGAVGTRVLRGFRTFRYEVRRWRNGVIPDLPYAIAGPVRIADDVVAVQSLLELVPLVPTPVWGRDESAAGEMWNSNSVTAWLLTQAGLVAQAGVPPRGGRAPGWHAGVRVAERHQVDPAPVGQLH